MSGTWSPRDAAKWKPDSTTKTEARGGTPPVVYWRTSNKDHFTQVEGAIRVFAAVQKVDDGAVKEGDFVSKDKVFFFSLDEPLAGEISTMWSISLERIAQMARDQVQIESETLFQWVYVQRAIRHDVWSFGNRNLFGKVALDHCHDPETPFQSDRDRPFASAPLQRLLARFRNEREEWEARPYLDAQESGEDEAAAVPVFQRLLDIQRTVEIGWKTGQGSRLGEEQRAKDIVLGHLSHLLSETNPASPETTQVRHCGAPIAGAFGLIQR